MLTSRLLCLAALAACPAALAQTVQPNPQHEELQVATGIQTMRVVVGGRGGYTPRDNCPVVVSHTNLSFDGGTYTAQGGFGEGEIAAASYTLPGTLFPLKITLMEVLVGQLNAAVSTTTQWSILVWDGIPTDPQPSGFPIEYTSDDETLPHIVMGPGTRGTNVQVSVDPGDPDQIYIYNTQNLSSKTFTVGFRIDHHNQQTSNPCFVAPPSGFNAFPCTDNTVVGCGTGYAQLNQPSQNWLYALNCGPNGCPPNGGWTRFSGLQTDLSILGQCYTGCRPRGDWMIRVTYDPVNCPPPTGACCFGTAGCFITDGTSCAQSGGTYKGPGTTCGTPVGGVFPGCSGPTNTVPVAVAGPDKSATDTDNSGSEVVVLDGSGSYDNDAGDFVANYRWTEGATVLQDGPAFLSHAFGVGNHTVTLTVTDSRGATASDTVLVSVAAGAGCDADANQDGNVDQGDVDYAINVVAGGNNPTGFDADFNRDGNVDQGDVDALINVVAGGNCP